MRVGVDATPLEGGTLYTGMGVYTGKLAQALAEARGGDEVVLLGYGRRPDAAPPGLPWVRLPVPPAGKLGPWLGHQLTLPRLVRRLELDVVHVTGVNLRLSEPGVPLWSPCPLVVTVHDAIPVTYYGRQGPALPWRLRLGYKLAIAAARRAAAVITVSETSRRDVAAHLGIRPERLRVVYNGVELSEPTDRGVARAALRRRGVPERYLLYAGSYEPRKNLLGAVHAYRKALATRDLPPLVLVVERASGHRAAVLRAVAASGIADRLHFVHSLPEDELAELYRGALLFIYTSLYEGFGFAPLQALACGVPVVAARAGSLPEVLGDAARLVDPSSADELAAAIVGLLDDPGAAAALARRGPSRAGQFTWAGAARETLEVYHAAAGRRSASLVAS